MGRALRGLSMVAVVAAMACAMPVAGRAQDLGLPNSQVLVIDLNVLFNETLFGERVARELEAQSAELAAENRRIEADLTEEEKALTERRAGMTAEAFRDAADAFDEKVQRIRAEQEAKARVLSDENENAQRRFLGAARPILERLMRESGAAVLLDTRSVLLSSDVVNVTDEAVERINEAIGDGKALSRDADEGAPQETPPLVVPPKE